MKKEERDTPLAKNIKRLRKERNLTQKELASKLNISYGALANYEMGFREPNSKAMAALENFFNVSGAYLRGETELMKWEDPEYMKDIKDDIGIASESLLNSTRKGSDKTIKMISDILVELRHTVNKEQRDNVDDYTQLIQQVIWETTQFIDVVDISNISESERCDKRELLAISHIQDCFKAYKTNLAQQKKDIENN